MKGEVKRRAGVVGTFPDGRLIVSRYTAYQRRDLMLVKFLGQELDLDLDVCQRAKVIVATHDGHK